MNCKDVTEKLSQLSEADLISFRANINAGFCPMHVWESRMKIVGDINNIVTQVAKEKGYTLPSIEQLVRMSGGREEFAENLSKYLGTSWEELENNYFNSNPTSL